MIKLRRIHLPPAILRKSKRFADMAERSRASIENSIDSVCNLRCHMRPEIALGICLQLYLRRKTDPSQALVQVH